MKRPGAKKTFNPGRIFRSSGLKHLDGIDRRLAVNFHENLPNLLASFKFIPYNIFNLNAYLYLFFPNDLFSTII